MPVAVALPSLQRDREIVASGTVVAQQGEAAAVVDEGNVQVAILVDVPQRRSLAPRRKQRKAGPLSAVTSRKTPAPPLRKNCACCALCHQFVVLFDVIVDVAVAHEQVEVPVVVRVEETPYPKTKIVQGLRSTEASFKTNLGVK